MSIDRSLKVSSALSRHRNVLSRTERIERMLDEGTWQEGEKVIGLPKVGNRKAGGKKKK